MISVADAKAFSKEEIVIINQTLENMGKHLEFLGYKIEKKPEKDKSEDYYFAAHHDVENDVIVVAFTSDLYFLGVNFLSVKPITPEMNNFINKANKVFNVARFYCEPDPVTGGSYMRFNTIYTGPYSKTTFALLIDLLKTDLNAILKMDNYEKIFLAAEASSSVRFKRTTTGGC